MIPERKRSVGANQSHGGSVEMQQRSMSATWCQPSSVPGHPCLSSAALQADERAMDVACGTEIVAHGVAQQVGTTGKTSSLDTNTAMLTVARSPHWEQAS